MQQGHFDEAVQQYQEAVKIKPGDAEAHTNQGLVLARQGRLREAVEHFREALLIQPGLREAQSSLDQLLTTGSPTR